MRTYAPALLIAAAWMPPLGALAAQSASPVVVEGRESVEQMKKFDPFIGVWIMVEYPRGTAVKPGNGDCSFTKTSHGMSVDVACGPSGDPATRIFWHPVDRRFVFRSFSVRNPVDLLFDGEYEFIAPATIRRTYKGYYGDGRMHLYRDTWTLESPDRLGQTTEHFTKGEWVHIFGASVYARRR